MHVRGLIEGRHYRVTQLRRERDGYHYVIEPVRPPGMGVEGWMRGRMSEVSRILKRRVEEMDARAEGQDGGRKRISKVVTRKKA